MKASHQHPAHGFVDEWARAQEKPRLCGSVGNEVESALIKESDRSHGQGRKQELCQVR